jgi:hypothetical protein
MVRTWTGNSLPLYQSTFTSFLFSAVVGWSFNFIDPFPVPQSLALRSQSCSDVIAYRGRGLAAAAPDPLVVAPGHLAVVPDLLPARPSFSPGADIDKAVVLVAQSVSAAVLAEAHTQDPLDYFAARSAEPVFAFPVHCRSRLGQVPCAAAVELECKTVPAWASAQAFELWADLRARSVVSHESD